MKNRLQAEPSMDTAQAMAIVRQKYPLAIVVEQDRIGMSELIVDPIRTDSARFATSGNCAQTWVSFAGYILKGADF